jgi:hypothetical protein
MSYDSAPPSVGQRLDALLGYLAPNKSNSQQPLAIQSQSKAVFGASGEVTHFENDAVISHRNVRGRNIDIPLSELVKQLPSDSPFAFEGDSALFQASLKDLKIADAGTDGFSVKTKLANNADVTLFVQRQPTKGDTGAVIAAGTGATVGAIGLGAMMLGSATLGLPLLGVSALALGASALVANQHGGGKLSITQAVNQDGELSIKEREVALSPFNLQPLAEGNPTNRDLNTSIDEGISPFADSTNPARED